MNIEERSIDSIKPYKKDLRVYKNIEGLVESIKRFGFKQPIAIESDGTIVCGGARYLAARKLKLQTVPCVVVDDLSPEEIKAYRLLDNKLRDGSSWSVSALKKELEQFDFDFSAFNVDFERDLVFYPDFSSIDDPEKEEIDEKKLRRFLDKIPRAFNIVVSCDDEEEQRELYERLIEEGYRTRVCNL